MGDLKPHFLYSFHFYCKPKGQTSLLLIKAYFLVVYTNLNPTVLENIA